MPEAYARPDPSLLPIERPRCPKCQDRMRLRRIESGPDGSDLRTFECSKCEHIHKVLAEDPMKLAKVAIELPVPMNAETVR
jgi:ribosomal protein L37AE/L43A